MQLVARLTGVFKVMGSVGRGVLLTHRSDQESTAITKEALACRTLMDQLGLEACSLKCLKA